jgi:hypothetical protein
VLAEQIDACASAAAAARTSKSQSLPGLSPIAFPARVRQHLYIADREQGTPADITEVANGLAPH